MAKTKQSIGKAIPAFLGIAVVAAVVYLAYKYFSRRHFGGGGGGPAGGPVGGVAGSYPYYGQPGRPSSPSGSGLSFGSGGGSRPKTPSITDSAFQPASVTQDFLNSIIEGFDASGNGQLVTDYANPELGGASLSSYGDNLGELSDSSITLPTEDTGSIFDSFSSWFDSWGGNPVDSNTGPSGSDITDQQISDYTSYFDSADFASGGYDGGGSYGDYGGGGYGGGSDYGGDYGGDSFDSFDYSGGGGGVDVGAEGY